MADKVKLAVNWAAACGGCDVAILDLEQKVLELSALADFVFWPVAMDFKRDHLRAMAPGSVDVGIFNGAVRTSEQKEDALLMRDKCKVLVAMGACACFGGIPGMGNVSDREAILRTAFVDTPSTDNPDDLRPETRSQVDGREVTLPALEERVRPLHQVVDVDLFMPGCPPTEERLLDLVDAVKALASGGAPPPAGTFLASDRGLCAECPRKATRGTRVVEKFTRPHLIQADPEVCLLDQGLVCMGVATRGGCGATCIAVGMPCRGCFGPLPAQHDPAAELVGALSVLPGPRGEWDMPVHQVINPVRTLKDPLGTLYRFTYPVSMGRRTIKEGG
jgi:F420-non-reducing hydrogenase small subunit